MDGTPGSPTVVMYGNDDSCRYFRLVDKSEDPGSNGTRAVQYDAAGEDHDGPIYLYANTPGVSFTNGECSQYRVYRCFQDSVSGINGSTAIDATDAGPPMERVLIKNYKQSDFTYMGIKYMNAPDSDDPGLKVEVAMITLDGEPEECTPTAAAQNPNLVWLRRACLDPAQFGNFTLHPSFGGGNVILCCRHDSMDAKHPHQLVLAPVDSIPDKMTLYFTWPTS